MMQTLTTITYGASIFYIVLVLILYLFQRRLLFHPEKRLYRPKYYGLAEMQSITLSTRDKIPITAWLKHGDTIMIYFHGNRGHIGDRSEKLKLFAERMGLLAISYRGFGSSEGIPTEEGLYADARAAMHYILEQYPLENIVLYGESLGSGVAVQMATEFKVGAVILEAPYTSVVSRGAAKYPYIPVKHIMKDRFDSISKMSKISSPLLIMHGEKDEVIPVEDGRALLSAANEPKKAVFFPDTHHTDFHLATLVEHTMEFIQEHTKMTH